MPKLFTVALVSFIGAAFALPHLPNLPDVNPYTFKSFEELALQSGFNSESYSIMTADGYILQLYRIPGKFTEPTPESAKPVVFFQHALECDMMEWVSNSPDRAPAFIMAEEGYDVWLGNNRGNKFGLSHVTKDHRQKSFWDWYQKDMGTQDVPAFIDFILNKTGQANLSYIGHSQGTTQFFIGASVLPDYYSEKVNLFAALAPVASTSNITIGALQIASQHISAIVVALVNVKQIYSIVPARPLASEALLVLCAIPKVGAVCDYIYSMSDQFEDPTSAAIAMSYLPSGSGYKDWVYYGQMIRDGEYFRYYDFGKRENKVLYDQEEPPMIPLENYNVPTGLFSGKYDRLASPLDVQWLSGQISDSVVFEKEYELMDHMTFIAGKDMSYFTYDVVNLVKKYNPLPSEAFLQ